MFPSSNKPRVLIYNPSGIAYPVVDRLSDRMDAEILCTSQLFSALDLAFHTRFHLILHVVSDPSAAIEFITDLSSRYRSNPLAYRTPFVGIVDSELAFTAIADLYAAGADEVLPLTLSVEALKKRIQRFLDTPSGHHATRAQDNKTQTQVTRELLQDNKRLLSQLEDERARCFDASNVKNRFLGNMSHELRTPLNAILGYAEIIQEDIAEGRVANASVDAGRIVQAGKHLLALVNNILELSQMQMGLMQVNVTPFELKPLVEQVASSLALYAAKHGNTLRVDCCDTCGVVALDEMKVRHILFNILTNAIKFTKDGQITVHACCTGQNSGDNLCITVGDTGVGIPDEVKRILFHDFTPGDDSSTRAHDGTGVGLSLTRRYTELMGGTIDLQSQPGVGTTITVVLPTQAAALSNQTPIGNQTPLGTQNQTG